MDSPHTCIIDLGTAVTKAGLASQSEPRLQTPSYVLCYSPLKMMDESEGKPLRPLPQGNYQHQSENDLNSVYRPQEPTELDPSFLRPFLSEILSELNAEKLLFLQNPAFEPRILYNNRKVIADYVFNNTHVKDLYFMKSGVAVGFAVGCITGTVIEMGHSTSSVSVVHDGYLCSQYGYLVARGGQLIDSVFEQQIKKQAGDVEPFGSQTSQFTSNYIRFHKRKLIEGYKIAYISSCFGESDFEERTFTLPDNQTVKLGLQVHPFMDPMKSSQFSQQKFPAKFMQGPTLFRGMHEGLMDSVEAVKEDIKGLLYKNIILVGGNSHLGLGKMVLQRLQKAKGEQKFCLRKYNESSCNYMGFVGGSIAATLPIFSNYWISQKEWREEDDHAFNRKCP